MIASFCCAATADANRFVGRSIADGCDSGIRKARIRTGRLPALPYPVLGYAVGSMDGRQIPDRNSTLIGDGVALLGAMFREHLAVVGEGFLQGDLLVVRLGNLIAER